MNCYLSQKDASFPSYELDGPFCDIVQKIWVEQHQIMELVLGRDFWYQNDHPRLRATHGLLFIKEMNFENFMNQARKLEQLIEGDYLFNFSLICIHSINTCIIPFHSFIIIS